MNDKQSMPKSRVINSKFSKWKDAHRRLAHGYQSKVSPSTAKAALNRENEKEDKSKASTKREDDEFLPESNEPLEEIDDPTKPMEAEQNKPAVTGGISEISSTEPTGELVGQEYHSKKNPAVHTTESESEPTKSISNGNNDSSETRATQITQGVDELVTESNSQSTSTVPSLMTTQRESLMATEMSHPRGPKVATLTTKSHVQHISQNPNATTGGPPLQGFPKFVYTLLPNLICYFYPSACDPKPTGKAERNLSADNMPGSLTIATLVGDDWQNSAHMDNQQLTEPASKKRLHENALDNINKPHGILDLRNRSIIVDFDSEDKDIYLGDRCQNYIFNFLWSLSFMTLWIIFTIYGQYTVIMFERFLRVHHVKAAEK